MKHSSHFSGVLSMMGINVGNGIGDLNSNPRHGCLLGKGMNPCSLFSYRLIVGQTDFFSLGKVTSLREKKALNSNHLCFSLKLTLCHLLFVVVEEMSKYIEY